MERVDAVVVGAGVVGLAIGRALATRGLETVILEAAAGIGSGISSRNSEVIHAGLYDTRDSLKARLCVVGRRALYAYCETHGVPHRRCGKLVVATSPAQIDALRAIESRGRVNGVEELRWLTGPEAEALEPGLRCVAALWSPVTGIIDSHGLMLALQGDMERAGGLLAVRSPLLRATLTGRGFRLEVGGDVPTELDAALLVNSAGLCAFDVAGRIQVAGDAPGSGRGYGPVPVPHFAKGNYFSLSGRSPFTRLIYPVPEPGGLGVHLTLDLGGQARFGPDVEWLPSGPVDRFDYAVRPSRGEIFYAAIRRYWPDLPDGALAPAYSGVRPKLKGPGEGPSDFLLQGPQEHGVSGLMNLFGIESPGLTSSLAIADAVVERLGL